MCYLARQQQKAPLEESLKTPPSEFPQLRPRWVGAAAAVVAVIATAALFVPRTAPSTPAQEEASMGAPPAVSTDTPVPGGVERTSLAPDDGVPSDEGVVAAGKTCHHGM